MNTIESDIVRLGTKDGDVFGDLRVVYRSYETITVYRIDPSEVAVRSGNKSFVIHWTSLNLGKVNVLKHFPNLLFKLISYEILGGQLNPLHHLSEIGFLHLIPGMKSDEKKFWFTVECKMRQGDNEFLKKADQAIKDNSFVVEDDTQVNNQLNKEEKDETELQDKGTPVRSSRRSGSELRSRRHKTAITIGPLSNKEIHRR